MEKTGLNKIVEIAESLDWKITGENENFELEKISPAGRDFTLNVCAETMKEFFRELFVIWNSFDVSYETYLWLGDDGHGKNGAPYDMKDVYEDVKACEEMIRELAGRIQEIIQ